MIGTPQSALEPIATAIFGILNGALSFTSLSPIYNSVPQGSVPPYTILENFTETPWNTMREFGKTCTIQLHTVSQALGDQEGLRIHNAARALLDYQTFAVSGHRLVQCKFESGDHWKEEAVGGVVTRHHVSIYRVDVTQPS